MAKNDMLLATFIVIIVICGIIGFPFLIKNGVEEQNKYQCELDKTDSMDCRVAKVKIIIGSLLVSIFSIFIIIVGSTVRIVTE